MSEAHNTPLNILGGCYLQNENHPPFLSSTSHFLKIPGILAAVISACWTVMAVRNRGARSGHSFLSIVASIAVVCFVRLLCLRPNELPPVNLSVHGNDVASSNSFCMDTGACFWLSFSLYCSSGWLLEQALAAGLRGISRRPCRSRPPLLRCR